MDRTSRLRVFGFCLALGALTLAQPALATYKNRYATTTRGAVTFAGNTLGLSKAAGAAGNTAPGILDSIGVFSTTNIGSTVGTYPAGTTSDWHLNSAAAVLTLPAGSSVLHAELIWGSTIAAGGQDITASVNAAVNFTVPAGSPVSVSPDPATAQTGGGRYVNSADVTALVQAAGAGTYVVGGVPGVNGTDDSANATGWTLAVVYGDSTQSVRNMTVFVGAEIGGAAAAQVSGFCTPPTGAVNGRILVTALEGDASKTGDTFLLGPTSTLTAANRLAGPNNPIANFFASQLNKDDGTLDTTGTFGPRNHDAAAGTNISGGRQGWDVTNVNGSAQLGNNQTSAFAQGTTTGDQYTVAGLGLQIDVFAPSFPVSVKQVDHATTFVGDVLTYTVTLTNNGGAAADNVVFNDPVLANTSFVAGSLTIDGAPSGAASPVGVSLGTIANGAQKVVVYQVHVDSLPASHDIRNTAHWTYQYTACASAIPGSVDTNEVISTMTVSDLQISKTDGATTYMPGSAIAYTIAVTNAGTDTATNATVTDTLPAVITAASWTCAGTGGATCTTLAGSGNINAMVTVPVGGTATFTVAGTVSSSASGNLTNTAMVSAPVGTTDPNPADNSATDTDTLVASADLAVIKTGPATVVAGGAISYTINISNHGPDAVPDAVLNDPTPPGLTFVSASAPCASGFPCTIGAFANGASITITTNYTVADGLAGNVTNIASVHSQTVPDPVPVNNTSTISTTITGAPDTASSVPVDARWMLALMTLLLVLAGAPLAKRKR